MTGPVTRAELADYQHEARRREFRICVWLGLRPGDVISCTDGDPDQYGAVVVEWDAVAPQTPTRGKVTGTTYTSGDFGDPGRVSGTVWLHPDDAAELAKITGPRPVFPGTEVRRP